MKKILTTILCGVLLFSCNSNKDEQHNTEMTKDQRIQLTDARIEGISVDGKVIPISKGASQELQESLKTFEPPSYESLQVTPQTAEAWRKMIDKVDSATAIKSVAVAKQLNIKVEKKKANGVPLRYITPSTIKPEYENAYFIHIHGGGFIFNGGDASYMEALIIANTLEIPVVSIDYRMPPEHPFPAGLNDAVTAYQWIKEKHSKHSLFMGGTSAGGGLTMSTILQLKTMNVELPQALFLGTPASDINKIGDSWYINENIDRIVVTYDGLIEEGFKLYVGEDDFMNPLLSPIYGDFKGFPPTFLVSGTRDMLLSNTVRAHLKLRESGVAADLFVLEGHSHGDYMVLLDSPETRTMYEEMDNFFMQYLKKL